MTKSHFLHLSCGFDFCHLTFEIIMRGSLFAVNGLSATKCLIYITIIPCFF
jgi:hypothetical protein